MQRSFQQWNAETLGVAWSRAGVMKDKSLLRDAIVDAVTLLCSHNPHFDHQAQDNQIGLNTHSIDSIPCTVMRTLEQVLTTDDDTNDNKSNSSNS